MARRRRVEGSTTGGRNALGQVRAAAAPLLGDRELRVYYLPFAGVWFATEAYAQALPLPE